MYPFASNRFSIFLTRKIISNAEQTNLFNIDIYLYTASHIQVEFATYNIEFQFKQRNFKFLFKNTQRP